MKRFILAVSVSLMAMTTANAAVTDADVANDQTITSQVATNGMGRNLQRFSPLDAINKDTVGCLVPAWAFVDDAIYASLEGGRIEKIFAEYRPTFMAPER